MTANISWSGVFAAHNILALSICGITAYDSIASSRAQVPSLAVQEWRPILTAEKRREASQLDPDTAYQLKLRKRDHTEYLIDADPTRLETVRPMPRPERLDLSLVQAGLYELAHTRKESAEFFSIEIPLSAEPLASAGDLPSVLKDILDQIVERHESLRTTIRVTDEGPELRIHEELPPSFETIDLSHLSGEDAVSRFGPEFLVPHRSKGIDIFNGPALRAGLFLLGARNILSIVTSRFHVDLTSQQILVAEIRARLQARLEARTLSIPPLSTQYADYVLCEREWIVPKPDTYWASRLSGIEPLTASAGGAPYRSGVGYVEIPRETAALVRHLAAAANATPHVVMMSALSALLAKSTGRHEVALGWMHHGRPPGTEGLIGSFGRSRPFIMRMLPDMTFKDLVSAGVNAEREAASLRHSISTDLVMQYGLHRFVVLGIFSSSALSSAGAGADPRRTRIVSETGGGEIYQLMLAQCEDAPPRLTFGFLFASDVIKSEWIGWLLDGLVALLAAGCTHPDLALSELPPFA